MTQRKTIGVVGYGFVGEAVAKGFNHVVDVIAWDKVKGFEQWTTTQKTIRGYTRQDDPWKALVRESTECIFICVPTPMRENGLCDTSIVEDVCSRLDQACVALGKSRTLVIKSTVPPDFPAWMEGKLESTTLLVNPEFLTEANYLKDFAEQQWVVIGGGSGGKEGLVSLYRWAFPKICVLRETHEKALLIKYLVNCFLAAKVSLANEFAQVCEKLSVDWEEVWAVASLDERLGTSHWQVPGPDGHNGFGGSCFPKDINAFIRFAEGFGVSCETLKGAWATNLRVRPECDWEQLKGRAVS